MWVFLRAPSAAEREGDTYGCADPLASVCQPSFVSPPSFDSDVVKLL
ncbi:MULTISPECIES: hypothetical protein [unclassified Acinetobacter]|nr:MULTISPECIES: hypothetical protein [unclassified Acinetobacter]MDH1084785.1 hypothetical protein [Acinetobacter sp. GD03983]MDH2191669.1 hypothetical protein [Acinetobacter sp. GD03645]